ncbi:MAG: phytoene/squalene synthase family protein [Bacillota bacterium]
MSTSYARVGLPWADATGRRRNLQRAYGTARQICQRGSHTFYLASWFMPPQRRRATWAVYAFCRTVDDLVDEQVLSPSHVRTHLDQWRLWLLAPHRPLSTPVHVALHDAITRLGLPITPLLHLLDGVEMDLGPVQLQSQADLQRYCYLVAGTVGEMMAHLFGSTDPRALHHARTLGEAMQLTNILRDVGEDLGRARLYLPAQLLFEFGVEPKELARGAITDGFRSLVELLARRAESMYDEGLAGCQYLPFWARPSVRAAAAMYRGILTEIRRNDYQVLTRRARLTGLARLTRGVAGALAVDGAVRP